MNKIRRHRFIAARLIHRLPSHVLLYRRRAETENRAPQGKRKQFNQNKDAG